MAIERPGYFLRSERLGFRLWAPADLDLAMGLWGDPLVTRLIDSRGQLSAAAVAERLQKEIATHAQYGVQYWPIFLLATHEHLGCCGLRPHDLRARVYELGVHIRSKHWGAGYACESSRAVIDYAFGTLGVGSLFAGHNPANHASRRLLAKLGFRHTHDELYPPTGLMHPSYTLAPRGVRAVPARERMDRLEFSGHVEHTDHVIHVGTYECPSCHATVELNTDHFRKHENNAFSNLEAPWKSRFDEARPLNVERWESFLDFHCPGCHAPVRLIYEAGSEWAMGAHGWRVTTILEAADAA